jgi:hypothetical protein
MQLSEPGRSAKLKWLFLLSLVLTFAFTLLMKRAVDPLQSSDIIKFEIAKTPDKAAAILQEWQQTGKFYPAITSIYWDYFFILFYTIMIALGCLFLSSVTGNALLKQTGKFFAPIIFLAGVFDVVENNAMLASLQEGITLERVDLTYKMAISKFSVVLMSIFFMAICLVSWIAGLLLKRSEVSSVKREMAILRSLQHRNSGTT